MVKPSSLTSLTSFAVYAYIPEYYGLSSERRSYGLDIAAGSWNFTVGA